jgi:hypothetical protein
MTFEKMPKIDMTIEPIVSSRQITYTLILSQIEKRFKEVVAESLVYPNWDDSPFFQSENKLWRGGIWADDRVSKPEDPKRAAAEEGVVDEVQQLESEQREAIMALPQVEKSISLPLVDAPPPSSVYSRKAAKSSLNLGASKESGSSTAVETRSLEKPRALRSGSFASASQPVVGTDVTNADAFKGSSQPEHSHAIDAMSALSQTTSPVHTPVGSPARPSRTEISESQSSASALCDDVEGNAEFEIAPQPSFNTPDTKLGFNPTPYPPSPSSISIASSKSEVPSTKSFGSFGSFGPDINRENSSARSSTAVETKRISLAAMTSAAATAKKWGWNAIQRNSEQKSDSQLGLKDAPSQPIAIGRGRPLP